MDGINRFVSKLARLVSSHAGLKPKKLSALVAPLASAEPTLTIEKVTRNRILIDQLKAGPNAGPLCSLIGVARS